MAADSGWVSGKTPEKSFAMSISDSVSYIVSKFPTGCAGQETVGGKDQGAADAWTQEVAQMVGTSAWSLETFSK